jgi:PTS system nitrogen regulatory IIA component
MTMNISGLLSPANVMVDVRASDKGQLLRDLSSVAASALRMPVELIATELGKREQLGSTGMGNGIAIPHARFAALARPFGILARLRQPIDFDAIDGQRVDLVFVLLLPASPEGEQLGALACVARQLRLSPVIDRLRRLREPAELYAAIAG